jgi:hypothetical protein
LTESELAGIISPAIPCQRGAGALAARRKNRRCSQRPQLQEAAMQIGLLWFDNDPNRGLAAKVEDAARRYWEKFGKPPDTCYVNQAALTNGAITIALPPTRGASLRVVPTANILPHHFWVGVEEASA